MTQRKNSEVTVVGAGLAGSEAAWQLAQAGLAVHLIEMKPHQRTPAQRSDFCAELVCSNSLRSQNPHNAVGLLKEEMRRLGSLIIATALEHRVPAGDALAVERRGFGAGIEAALRGHPRIRRSCARLDRLPAADDGPWVMATGPLTTDALAADLAAHCGGDSLYFYDALAPIVSGDSIDRDIAFAASRYGKGDGSDYLNCPFDQASYESFLEALLAAEGMPHHAFETPKYFQGCMPLEEVARSGRDALRFGALKPVGLWPPGGGPRPHAVLQLRKEDKAGQAFNLVGCQTKLKYPEQLRVFRLVPGLAQAQFVRLGAMHRNTFVDGPRVLDERGRLRRAPHVRLAGQITGVEGYVESAAHGLLVALLLAADQGARAAAAPAPPPTCALGALWAHVRGTARLPGRPHEPSNVNWSLFAPLPPGTRVPKAVQKGQRVERAQEAFETWARASGLPLLPRAAVGLESPDVRRAL